jgi:outer membrane lipoprotein LolB
MRPALALTLTCVLGGFVLGGCTTLVRPKGAANQAAWQKRLAQLKKLHAWHLDGRIGVVTPQHGGSASFNWHEKGRYMTLGFSGPFGIGGVKLSGTPDRIVIRDSKGNERVTDRPAQALAQSVGWPVPVASLRYWVTGRPAPGSPYKLHLDASGLVTGLVQQGWTVRYSAYMRVDDLLLPARLAASREGTHVKLIASGWSLPDTP